MKYEDIAKKLRSISKLKTKDIDILNKQLIRAGEEVKDLREYVLKDELVHRTYFQVSLGEMKDINQQFAFIEENFALLQDWWHVDQLTQFILKPVDFDFAFEKASQYIQSEMPFVRRWGYVLFLTGLQKDKEHTTDILALLKDDEAYYVQMAEAWLLCDLAVYHPQPVIDFIEKSNLKYNILGKAIQKACDSYRIAERDKDYLKSLRTRLKKN